MVQLEQKMTSMVKQLEKRPNRSFTLEDKNIKATELRLEAKINFAIERVNEVIFLYCLKIIQALKKQDSKIQSLMHNPNKSHTRISSIQNTTHQVSRDSLGTSVKKSTQTLQNSTTNVQV